MERDDIIRNLCVAATAAIPVTGGTISVLMDKYLPNKLEERKKKVLENIQNDLSKIDINILKNNLDNEEFYTVFLKILNKSIANHREEKLIAFRNILLSNLTVDYCAFDEVSFFIRITDELTVDQLRILNVFYQSDIIKNERYLELLNKFGGSLPKLMGAIWKDVDEDYVMACTTELIRFWLVLASNKNKERASLNRFSLSKLGERYAKYIFSPITNNFII